MKIEDFNPYVRFFNRIVGAPVYDTMVCAYDFRLFYLIKGGATFEFEGESHRLTAGDVIIIKPGIAYKLSFDMSAEPQYYLINFDFVYYKHYRIVCPPVDHKVFDKKQIFSEECIEPFGDIFVMQNFQKIEPALEEMYECSIMDRDDRLLLWSALLKNILTKIIIKSRANADQGDAFGLIQDVKNYVYQNCDKGITNTSVARHFGYHPYYLSRIFLNSQNITLHRFIDKARLNKAKEKLSLTEKPISAISREMGFTDCSYFSAFFKKVSGMTPKEYRKLCR